MSRKPAENPPLFPEEPLAEVAYCHDGSLEGLLSAVFEAYARREDPQDVARADVLQPRLGQTVRVIETNEEHAVRVRRGIRRACGDAAYDAVKHASLSDHPDAGTIVYRFIRYAMAQSRPHDCSGCKRRGSCGGACGKFACTGKARRSVLGDLAHPAVEPLHRLARSVMNERHRMLQFLRFEHLENGVWFARCNPAASVIPLLMDWFSGRFNTQPFIIFDEAHNIAGVYEGRDWYLVQTENVDLPDRASEERLMQQAWKRFYDTVAVEARSTPSCAASSCPSASGRTSPRCRKTSPERKSPRANVRASLRSGSPPRHRAIRCGSEALRDGDFGSASAKRPPPLSANG